MASATLILDDASIRVPGEAFHFDGFLRWIHSGSLNGRRASFLVDQVYLEMNDQVSLHIPDDVLSLEGFLRWVHSPDFPERGRPSFLAGEVSIDMSPEELVTHNFVKADVGADITFWNRRRKLGRLFADRALLIHGPTGLSTEPDLMFCLHTSLKAGRVRLAEVVQGSGRYVEVRGSPDLIVEIISDTSVQKDTRDLPPRYFAAGVQEYWLIDARGRRLDFRIFVRGRKRFVAIKPDAKGYVRSRVLNGAFRLSRKKGSAAISQYRLLAKKQSKSEKDAYDIE
jgi:Uma2 family endonuclease